MSNSWIPVISGKYPPVLADVQVTYEIDSMSPGHKYYKCDMFAYVVEDESGSNKYQWRCSDNGEPILVKVIAWRYNDDAYDPNKKTVPNGYNSIVRRCISDEYVRVSKELQMVKLKHSEVCEQFRDKSISHSEYLDKEKYLKVLENDIKRLEVELNTWDAAREICMNVVDSMK